MKHLFVVAHPDDEILGACGAILRAKARGDRVAVAIASDISATRESGLREIAAQTHKKLRVDATYYFGWTMMKFSTYDRYEMTQTVEKIIKKEKPDIVYTHDENDIHNDHRVLGEIVREAVKLPLRGTYKRPIRGVYLLEILSSTDWGRGFIPNAFVEISKEDLSTKAALLEYYDDVIRDIPHPRNYETLKSLARYRGGQCGCEYAEAFRKIFELTGGKNV